MSRGLTFQWLQCFSLRRWHFFWLTVCMVITFLLLLQFRVSFDFLDVFRANRVDGIESPTNPAHSSLSRPPATHQPPDSTVHTDHPVELSKSVKMDYKDPLDATRDMFYGPWKAKIPTIVYAGQEFSMQFICTYPEESICPPYYMVLFHGATKLSVSPEKFGTLNWTNIAPNEYAVVNATFVIHDPGQYRIFAYPQFMICDSWSNLRYPWYMAVVQDCPLNITVLPNEYDHFIEGYGNCATEQIENGRYLSTNPSLSTPEFAAMYNHTQRSYIYAPYECKIRHHTVLDNIKLLPSLEHLVFFGDSTLRGPFCTLIWLGVHGTVANTLCDSIDHFDEYHDNKWGHKTSVAMLGEEQGFAEKRNVSLSLVWTPDWRHFEENNIPYVLAMDPPPTHIVFNMGFWLAWETVESLEQNYWSFLEFIHTRFPQSVQHVILRTTTSVVQPVHCYGEINTQYGQPAPEDSVDFRIGGAKKRSAIYNVATKWKRMYHSSGTFRVSVVDAWMLTDNFPESTSEGRHWVPEFRKDWDRRSCQGQAEGLSPMIYSSDPADSITDLTFDHFIYEREIP